ncbi:MAG: hypothetical protein R8P61_24615 [Bacteroidia bacterium]|nr:hypothetical protein [Bacteroidia bacterium]
MNNSNSKYLVRNLFIIIALIIPILGIYMAVSAYAARHYADAGIILAAVSIPVSVALYRIMAQAGS